MKEFLIIGSGFSALVCYLYLKKYNPEVISCDSSIFLRNEFSLRKNLNINKFFNEKTNSYGNFNYKLDTNIKIHDRLSSGGNSNIWGGFIDIDTIPKNFIKLLVDNEIELNKLSFDQNGYISNRNSIRQLRIKNEILDSKYILHNKKNGFIYSIEIFKNFLQIKYLSDSSKIIKENFKKIILAISLPQLIDLLYRSNIISSDLNLSLSEFNHKFVKTFNSQLRKDDFEKKCIIKYDLIRAIKHYLGYTKNLDQIKIKTPLYVDQIYSFPKRKLRMKLDYKNKSIFNLKTSKKFGDSIHYCDLKINNIEVSKLFNNYSSNLFGVSMPFVNQKIPGPISNDIINNILERL